MQRGLEISNPDPAKPFSLLLRAGTSAELEDWKKALDHEVGAASSAASKRSNTDAAGPPKAAIFDIGSASIRAGLARGGMSWPSLYNPSVLSRDETNCNPATRYSAFPSPL